jgi:hypothetical protein
MKKIFYGLLFLVIAGPLFTGGGPVFAQGEEPAGFKNVTLWVYPEYDDPRLLVMLEGQIDGATPPATVRFLVPSTALMYSAGSIDDQHNYTGGPPRREASHVAGWDEISYEATSETFRVEYYDAIIIGQPDKSISYDFRWLFPIADLTAIVQVPETATDFNVSPAGRDVIDGNGFTTYQYEFSALNPGDPPLHFDISYYKTDAVPSLQAPATASGGTSHTLLLAVIAGVVALMAVGGFFWLRKPQPANRAARRQAVRNAAARQNAGSRPARFCTQCGKPVNGSYKYCPGCGKKLG